MKFARGKLRNHRGFLTEISCCAIRKILSAVPATKQKISAHGLDPNKASSPIPAKVPPIVGKKALQVVSSAVTTRIIGADNGGRLVVWLFFESRGDVDIPGKYSEKMFPCLVATKSVHSKGMRWEFPPRTSQEKCLQRNL